MIRLSVSDLDQYLYWRETEEQPLAVLIERLTYKQEETEQMRAGKAFHKVLEHASESELLECRRDGFQFCFQLDSELAVPAIRELKGEIVINTPSGPVTLVGKVDAMEALEVTDYKLTERFDAERYADSYQWRSYLLMFGARTFIYEAFQYRWDQRSASPRLIIYEHHSMRFHAYPAMRADVEHAVAGLAEIVAKHVPEKIMQEAAA